MEITILAWRARQRRRADTTRLFQNVDQIILPVVTKDRSDLGLDVPQAENVSALASLVEDGLAKAYDLQKLASNGDPFSGELPGMPPVDEVEQDFRTYFYITEEGMQLHLADDPPWPFDDDGEPRPDWHLDESPGSL
jgi:hypothetical protein